jgi:DNA-binding winged helix-turn-helix (wHTH) protein
MTSTALGLAPPSDDPRSPHVSPTTLVVSLRLQLDDPDDLGAARVVELLQQLTGDLTPVIETTLEPEVIAPPAIRILPDSRTVFRGSAEIQLTRREFDLLLCLADHPQQVLSRPQLISQAWGHPYTGHRSVDVHIRRLRVKIGLPIIRTVRGVGYRLDGDTPVLVQRLVPVTGANDDERNRPRHWPDRITDPCHPRSRANDRGASRQPGPQGR